MRTTFLGVVLVAAGCLMFGAAACGAGADTTAPTSTFAPPADEQAALVALHGACKVASDAKLEAEASEANTIMQQHGITDETTVTVLQHLRQAIPAEGPVMDCSEVLSDYVELREHGGS